MNNLYIIEKLKKEREMNQLTKGIMIGFMLGLLFVSCNNTVMADDTDDYGEIGTVSWNPLYVKIVE